MSNKQNDIINEMKYDNDFKSDYNDHYFCCHQDGTCYVPEKEQPKQVPYRYHTMHSGKFGAMTQSEHDLYDEVREDRI